MKKIKFSVLICLITLGLSVGVYNAKAAMTNTEVQTLITAFGSMGLTQAQLTNMINILQGMVTGSAVNNTAPVISSTNSLGSVANVASGISDLPRGTGTDNTAPVSSSANSLGSALASVYSVTVDYGKTIDQLLTALNIPKTNRSDEFNLGLFSNNTGTGQKNLDFLTIRTTDLFPGVDGRLTYNPVPISDIYSKMHEKGYRPATLQEFLTVAVKYPQLLQTSSMYQAFGSLIKTSSLEKISVTGIFRYYKYFMPYVFSGKVGLGAFGLSNTTPDSIDRNNSLNPPLDFDKINLNSSAPLARALWFVVRDPSAPISAPISLNALPSTVAKGSNNYYFYLLLTDESYPVAVDYDKTIAMTVMNARDIPLGALRPLPIGAVASPTTGKANINIILGQVKGMAGSMEGSAMRDVIANSSFFSGYRFATAKELYDLNEQYPDINRFNAGGGILAFGSYNFDCDGWPIIYTIGLHKDASGNISGHGTTIYNDLKFIDYSKCTIPNEWYFDGIKHSMNSIPGFSACHTTNAFDVKTWKFALVKI